MSRLFSVLVALIFGVTSHAGTVSAPPSVILITLDGVRWQEFIGGVDPEVSGDLPAHQPDFTHAWSQHPDLLVGAPNDGMTMKISNPAKVSLPAYQSIFAGEFTGCRDNQCPRTSYHTFAEALVEDHGMLTSQVAAFSSWERIERALERTPGRIFSNTGARAIPLAGFEDLNTEMVRHPSPWDEARLDAVTFEAGLRYLQSARPRFLYISLNDTDELAHRGDYRGYTRALRDDDARIQRLADTLAAMGDYGQSAHLIVTTDHGRGTRGNWRNHGDWVQGAERIWMTASGPFFKSLPRSWADKRAWEHTDLRPLIEQILTSPKMSRQSELSSAE